MSGGDEEKCNKNKCNTIKKIYSWCKRYELLHVPSRSDENGMKSELKLKKERNKREQVNLVSFHTVGALVVAIHLTASILMASLDLIGGGGGG